MYSKFTVERSRYIDSVTLMQIRSKAMKIKGALLAELQMATPANINVLTDLGFDVPQGLHENDLICGIHADCEETAEKISEAITQALDHRGSEPAEYSTLDEIDFDETGNYLVQISLPGEFAAEEAKKAIEYGCDVFIFSDNVSLAEEREIKEVGLKYNKLVMGPDCGVGLLNGVCLGVGSIMRDGPIGIVGASGSGAQEVACIIEKCGYGVSAIIGTGGHDLFAEVGGITMIEGIKRLESDESTKVIVLVSKLADTLVMNKVLDFADTVTKPVAAVFLGDDGSLFKGHKVHGAESLEGAALLAVEFLTGEKISWGYSDEELERLAGDELRKLAPEQKYFRGLFCGGTFTEESLIYFSRHNSGVSLYTNLSNRYARQLEDAKVSRENSILDLGAENFTEKAPHPVFDSSLRAARLKKELEDAELAVVMLDFITGPAVDEDPFSKLAALCREVNRGERHITFIGAICGSDSDPQDIKAKKKLLEESGFIVTGSNYQSTRLAGKMMEKLSRRG